MNRAITEAASDHRTQVHWSEVETAKTRMARNQPATAATPDTSEAANSPRLPVATSASQARKKGRDDDVGVLQRRLQDSGDATPTKRLDLAGLKGHTPVADAHQDRAATVAVGITGVE